jgi:hypothetical protein
LQVLFEQPAAPQGSLMPHIIPAQVCCVDMSKQRVAPLTHMLQTSCAELQLWPVGQAVAVADGIPLSQV